MSFLNFQAKLKQFSCYEDVLALKLIEKYQLSSTYLKNDDNKFDLQLSNGLTYELKCDMMGNKTGNCFIEFAGYGKPSGIATSEADYYVFTFDLLTYHQIELMKLKEIIQNGKFRIVKTADKSTYGHLVSMKTIIANAEQI